MPLGVQEKKVLREKIHMPLALEEKDKKLQRRPTSFADIQFKL
jgi:hypothetical protein